MFFVRQRKLEPLRIMVVRDDLFELQINESLLSTSEGLARSFLLLLVDVLLVVG
jgi:hypothetical protein